MIALVYGLMIAFVHGLMIALIRGLMIALVHSWTPIKGRARMLSPVIH
jgi:flagellar biosynthesis protein FliQ